MERKMNSSTLRQEAQELIKAKDGDVCAVYASVWNQTLGEHPDKELLELKRELERLMVEEFMYGMFWELTETNEWRFVSPEEYRTRMTQEE